MLSVLRILPRVRDEIVLLVAVPLRLVGSTWHLCESAFADVLFVVIPCEKATVCLLHYVSLNSLCVTLGNM